MFKSSLVSLSQYISVLGLEFFKGIDSAFGVGFRLPVGQMDVLVGLGIGVFEFYVTQPTQGIINGYGLSFN